MTERHRYDLAVIGSGAAAFAAAIRGTELGARVAIVERAAVGGTCVNVGCIPSKHLLAASDLYRTAGDHRFGGVSVRQDGVDVTRLVAKKADVISEMRREKYVDLAGHHGFQIVHGDARFVAPDRLRADGPEIA